MIEEIDAKIKELRSRMESVGAIRYDKIRVQSSPKDPMEENMQMLLDAEAELLALEARLSADHVEIQKKILMLDNELYQTILTKRYLSGKPLPKVAEEINYSENWTWKLHGRALKAFDKILQTTPTNTNESVLT